MFNYLKSYTSLQCRSKKSSNNTAVKCKCINKSADLAKIKCGFHLVIVVNFVPRNLQMLRAHVWKSKAKLGLSDSIPN